MGYTVRELARLAGISPRTIRYYDEIDLLKPAQVSAAGYRLYGQAEVDRLQQILFYRELGVELKQIKQLISAPSFDELATLKEHRTKLLAKRRQVDLLIANVEKTIASKEGKITMTDEEKFEAFKQKMIVQNEEKYGAEIRAQYGDETIDQANAMLKNMTAEQYEEWQQLGEAVLETLKAAMATGDPASALAQKTADLHRRWLNFTWKHYDQKAHAGLARMYVDDPRFTAYYDAQVRTGAAEFLRDAILIYTGTMK
ncbi:MAG TPA: MerR family transcriptional regulator [Firmicutes bacterium]|nr:MerR family transcriptional regulator [Bacillota bacterium]